AEPGAPPEPTTGFTESAPASAGGSSGQGRIVTELEEARGSLPQGTGWREEGEYGDDRDWKRRFRRDEYDTDFEPATLGRAGPLSSDWQPDFGKWWSAATQNWSLYLGQAIGYALVAGGIYLGLQCMGSIGLIASLFVTPPLWAGFILCAHKCLRGE